MATTYFLKPDTFYLPVPGNEHKLILNVANNFNAAGAATLHVDGNGSIQGKLPSSSAPRLLVRNGAIVQTDDWDEDPNAATPSILYPNVDAKSVTIGKLPTNIIDAKNGGFHPNRYYGVALQWDSDCAGLQLMDVERDDAPDGELDLVGGKPFYSPDSGHKDAVLFWGDGWADQLRIRFIGHVPPWIDRGKGKNKDKYGKDDFVHHDEGVRESKGKKESAFKGGNYHRDIMIIQADGSVHVNGCVYAFKGNAKYSDVRLKKSIEPIYHAVGTVRAMRGVSYVWNPGEVDDELCEEKRQLGFIAQEIERVCPEVVADTRLNDKPTKTVDYTQIVPVLVEAIKEQQDLIEQQRDRIDALEKSLPRKHRPSHTSHRRKRLS